MNVAIITINNNGEKIARRLKADFPGAKIFDTRIGRKDELKNLIKDIFNQYEGLIFIAAVGITVRLISGFIKSKLYDPAVVSVDTAGRFQLAFFQGMKEGQISLRFWLQQV